MASPSGCCVTLCLAALLGSAAALGPAAGAGAACVPCLALAGGVAARSTAAGAAGCTSAASCCSCHHQISTAWVLPPRNDTAAGNTTARVCNMTHLRFDGAGDPRLERREAAEDAPAEPRGEHVAKLLSEQGHLELGLPAWQASVESVHSYRPSDLTCITPGVNAAYTAVCSSKRKHQMASIQLQWCACGSWVNECVDTERTFCCGHSPGSAAS